MMELRYVIKLLSLPPGLFLLLLVVIAGVAPMPRRWRLFLGAVVALFWLLSTPFVAERLIALVENHPPLNAGQVQSTDAQAIVVLGGGTYEGSEYGEVTTGIKSLARLRYGAWLARHTGLPLLLSGGRVFAEGPKEADLMAHVLADEFGLQARWLETGSRTTAENAVNSWQLLHSAEVDKILLVTHAWHMQRAKEAFVAQGFQVVAAPTLFSLPGGVNWLSFIPNAKALALTTLALHEQLGRWLYRLKRGMAW